jgi:hypothetical protein
MKFSVEHRQANALAVFAADGRWCMAAYLVDDPLENAGFEGQILETVAKTVKDQPSILGDMTVDYPIGDARRFLRALAELVRCEVRK